jgi:murein DD-endopeptidase MepM/ murein hydrolase activator NlpD
MPVRQLSTGVCRFVTSSTGEPRRLSRRRAEREPWPMRLLVPAASAALFTAMALSASAGQVDSAPVRSSGPTLSATAGGTATTPLAGADPAAAAPVPQRGNFAWPLSPRPGVFRRFEQPRNPWSPGHRGADLLTAVGQPVLSAGEGVVAFSGVVAGRGVITIRHSGGLRTTYEPVNERLASRSFVHRGVRIGVVSPTPGHCVPLICLHWGAISGQTYRDPLSLLGFGRPVLLPLG